MRNRTGRWIEERNDCGTGGASSVMTVKTSGTQKVKKIICEKVGKSAMKGASVGSGWNGDTSSVVMTSATEQTPAVQDMSAQTKPICREMIVTRTCSTAEVGCLNLNPSGSKLK